jgi:5'-nucleotidase
MQPMPGAVKASEELAALFETYTLSASPWNNPTAWSDKLIWVKRHLGAQAYKWLILSLHNHLNRDDYLTEGRSGIIKCAWFPIPLT